MANIFIFRRDLRIWDNNGLNSMIHNKMEILPIFIYNPEQIDKKSNKYFSDKCVEFMHKSLIDLNQDILENNGNLTFYYGETIEVLNNIIKNNNINSINVNEDYSLYSIRRDLKIKNLCKENDIVFNLYQDIPLYNFKTIKTKSGTAYKKFKWFYKKTLDMTIPNIYYPQIFNFSKTTLESKYNCELNLINSKYKPTINIFLQGGRNNGLDILKNNISNLKNYTDIRAYPILNNNKNSTSFLSAYNKFGCISIREVVKHLEDTLGDDAQPIIRQIVWRDFYYNITYFYPNIFKGLKKSAMSKFPWSKSKINFKRWKNGKTGFPFVDAGMRQLFKEGYMNNRARLCCACFLIKNLHINWLEGEKYFAQQLIDYDPSVNNGNWQWVASSSYESQAYYRYMNPTKDLKKYDPECLYIKKYIPELRNESIKAIHTGKYSKKCLYIEPIVDFKLSINKFKELFNKVQ